MRAVWLAPALFLAATGLGSAETRLPTIVQFATTNQAPPLPQAATGRAVYLDLIAREAALYGLPRDVADAVAQIESGYDPTVIGGVGEIGLMQVRPTTATMLGFMGSLEDLARPEVNVHFGVRYLARAWRLAGGDLCRALMKYRAGHGEEAMTPLSVTYCERAKAHLAAIDSKLEFEKPVSLFAAPALAAPMAVPASKPAVTAAVTGPKSRKALATTPSFWEAHEARVRALNAKIEARWRQRGAKV